jgi:hypothetical protein
MLDAPLGSDPLLTQGLPMEEIAAIAEMNTDDVRALIM